MKNKKNNGRGFVMKNKVILLVAVAFFAIVGISASGEKEEMSEKIIVEIPKFNEVTSEQAKDFTNNTVAAYDKIISELLSQLRETKLNNESKVNIIYILGSYRAIKAAGILVDLIDLRAEKVDPKVGGIGRWGPYPAQEALTRIGRKAEYAIFPKLAVEKNELRRKLMCFTILEIDGKEKGRSLIEKEIAKESDNERKANLQAALKYFEK